MRRAVLVALVLGAIALTATPAVATTVDFTCLTNTNLGDCAIGESQFRVTLSDQGGGVVRFHFKNLGPAASVLSEVYFDDGSLLAISNVIDGPGVDFEPDASPPNLPGGQNAVPPFQVTEGFLAESVPSPSQNGAGPTEWVAIEFTLQSGQTIDDVMDQLASGQLRIGIHVIAFASGGSESFINAPLVPVPEPGTALLISCALLGLGALRNLQPRS